jgi:CCR4-NOT transcription complex subunit 6
MNTKDFVYSWHLSLRVDRPVEGCPMRPHAYMYGKKMDEREWEKTPQLHSKKCAQPPPPHEFSYRWFRGPLHEPCAYDACVRRTSFSPHDWSKHALGGTECALQCVSTQSSLYRCMFCNAQCFVQAWKTQYTVYNNNNSNNPATSTANNSSHHGGSSTSIMVNKDGSSGGAVYSGGGSGTMSRSNTPLRSRSASIGSSLSVDDFDETASARSSGSRSPNFDLYNPATNTTAVNTANTSSNNSTPRGYMSGYHPSHPHPLNTVATNEYNAGEDWIEVCRDPLYMPGPDDVGRKLKMEAAAYSLETGELLMSRVVKTDVVLARAPDPQPRVWVSAAGNGNTNSNNNNNNNTTSAPSGLNSNNAPNSMGGGPRLRIATYNVLAEIYATQQQYPYCDFWALSWDYRFQNILREILDAAPDVLCLQEVQADYYENHVYAAMSEAGYEGVYKQKTRQSMGLAGKVDGCALFWRRSKCHLVESYSIEFNEVAQRQVTQVLGLNPRSEEGSAFLSRLSKDNVAQLVVLEFMQPVSRTRNEMAQICVANTHLYSNKDCPDVKLWQTWQLLQELESYVMSRGQSLPLILCGDFNSTPDTAVYTLLSRQTVHPGHPDVNVSNNDDVPNVLPDPMNITHSFQLGSAYQTVMGEEPWVTNFTANFKGVLDYIWYSAPTLRPLAVAPIPDEKQLSKHGEALPSTEYSSDHIMLMADFQIVTNGAR